MSSNDFQLLDNQPLDNSIIKGDVTKIYHRQGDQLNQSDQNIEFIFGENNNYHQIGKSYLEFNITVRKNDDTNFYHEDTVRLVNNGYAFCFKEARLSTTIGSDIDFNQFCGQVSTIMKAISNKDGDLISQFDNIIENDILNLGRLADLPPQIRYTPHQKMLIDNHTDANKGKIKGRTRADTANKNNNIAIFDNLNLQNYYIENYSVRYLRDSVLINYEQNDYIEQYKDLKIFFKEYIGEELMSPFISYLDMKTKYPIEILDLRHQPDHITLKKIQLFQETSADPENAKFYFLLISRREKELISDDNKLIEIKII